MPIYEYRCVECGHELEVWARVSDPPPEACPACNEPSLRKAVSRTSFQLKGGGWYAQGYSNGGKNGTNGDKSESSKSDGAAKADKGGKSESKTSTASAAG